MNGNVDSDDITHRFEAMVLPHLDAAYGLARWLTRNDYDAEDVVQAAFMRAFRFFRNFRDGNVKVWLLTIVRRTYYTTLRDHRHEARDVGYDELLHGDADAIGDGGVFRAGSHPESVAQSRDTQRLVNQALWRLPQGYREVIVLKDMENLSYKEIAEIVDIPIGTVMSRLSRGRKLLIGYLEECGLGESNGLQ